MLRQQGLPLGKGGRHRGTKAEEYNKIWILERPAFQTYLLFFFFFGGKEDQKNVNKI